VASLASDFVVKNAENEAAQRRVYAVAISNGRNVAPYNALSPATLTIDVEEAPSTTKTFTDALQGMQFYNNGSSGNVALSVAGPELETTSKTLGGATGSNMYIYIFGTPAKTGTTAQTDTYQIDIKFDSVKPVVAQCVAGSLFLKGGFDSPFDTLGTSFSKQVPVARGGGPVNQPFVIAVWCKPQSGGNELLEVSRQSTAFLFMFRPK